MTKKQVTAIGFFKSIGDLLILVGAFLMLKHHPNGLIILMTGFIISSLTSSFDTFRLKKKIKKLEEQLSHKN
jgi:hypothetical protein